MTVGIVAFVTRVAPHLGREVRARRTRQKSAAAAIRARQNSGILSTRRPLATAAATPDRGELHHADD
jgi:hypothetical protein